jgi:HEAT repeat protein
MDFYRPPTAQGTLDALSNFYRAVRAWRFYPKGHPSRRNSLSLAHSAMLRLLDGNTLSLACGRTGFSFPDGEFLKDSSGLSAALAFELFVRRVQKISFFHDLFQEDLLELCKIMCLSPEVIQQSGGIDTLMAARGIRSIWVNEFDLAAIRGKRQRVEQTGIIPQGVDEAETEGDIPPVTALQPPESDKLTPAEQLQVLLGRLATCIDDDTYLILIRQAVACADTLQLRSDPRQLFPFIELLAGHAGDGERSEHMQECAQFAMEQIVTTGDILQIVLSQIEQGNGVSKKALHAVLKAGGTTAVTSAIELIGRTSSIKARKTLSTLLEGLGETAVPALLDLMNDSRWFIIRNICAILGSIASHEALDALTKCLNHPDLRVRKEAIRSVAQLGGREAEVAILGILRSTDAALHPQAIASLGGMKSKLALADLMKILFQRDMFLKSLQLKIDVLGAIAAIGERQVTPHLVTLLDERHLLAAARGRQLKTAVAICLGKLGDAAAIPALQKLVSGGGEPGSAGADAIALIQKSEGKPDGIS